MTTQLVDVVVVAYQCRNAVLECCASVRDSTVPTRLVVVDNASTDGTAGAVRQRFPQAEVIANSDNVGFARAVNQGLDRGNASRVLLLNPDTRLAADDLAELVLALDADSDLAGVGPRLRDEHGLLELSVGRSLSLLNETAFKVMERLQHLGVLDGWLERRYGHDRRTDSLTAACLLLRRQAWEDVGGLDERFFLYAEDIDLCRRLRAAGWQLGYVSGVTVLHRRGLAGASGPERTERHYRASQIAFYAKHRNALSRTILRMYLLTKYRLRALRGSESARRMVAWLRDQAPPGDRPAGT